MFDVHCTACDRRRMLSAGRVLGIRNDAAGIHVAFRCHCGALGTWHTGRAVTEREAVEVVPLAVAS
jgi:hypothetical protein